MAGAQLDILGARAKKCREPFLLKERSTWAFFSFFTCFSLHSRGSTRGALEHRARDSLPQLPPPFICSSVTWYMYIVYEYIYIFDNTDQKKEIFGLLQGIQQLFQGNLGTLNPKMTIILLNQLVFLGYHKKTIFLNI